MPTKEQMDTVVTHIEWLQSMSYMIDGGRIGIVSDCFQPWWEDLSRQQQQQVLREAVDWEGFTESQLDDVINRVVQGEDPQFWMDGVVASVATTPAPRPTPSELVDRQKSHAPGNAKTFNEPHHGHRRPKHSY